MPHTHQAVYPTIESALFHALLLPRVFALFILALAYLPEVSFLPNLSHFPLLTSPSPDPKDHHLIETGPATRPFQPAGRSSLILDTVLLTRGGDGGVGRREARKTGCRRDAFRCTQIRDAGGRMPVSIRPKSPDLDAEKNLTTKTNSRRDAFRSTQIRGVLAAGGLNRPKKRKIEDKTAEERNAARKNEVRRRDAFRCSPIWDPPEPPARKEPKSAVLQHEKPPPARRRDVFACSPEAAGGTLSVAALAGRQKIGGVPKKTIFEPIRSRRRVRPEKNGSESRKINRERPPDSQNHGREDGPGFNTAHHAERGGCRRDAFRCTPIWDRPGPKSPGSPNLAVFRAKTRLRSGRRDAFRCTPS